MEGIKESLELGDGLIVLLVGLKKIGADGKLNFSDAADVIEMLQNLPVLMAAVKDASKIKDEVKDLDDAELAALGAKYMELVKALRDPAA